MDSDGITSFKELSIILKEDIRRRMIMGIGIDIDKMVEEYDAILRPMKEDMGIDEFELQLKLDGYRKGLEEGFGVAWDMIIKRETGLWHDVSEKPRFDNTVGALNQIVVSGKNTASGFTAMSVASLNEDGTLFCPINEKEYEWGECPFTKWAYAKDVLIGLVL